MTALNACSLDSSVVCSVANAIVEREICVQIGPGSLYRGAELYTHNLLSTVISINTTL